MTIAENKTMPVKKIIERLLELDWTFKYAPSLLIIYQHPDLVQAEFDLKQNICPAWVEIDLNQV